MFDIITTLLEQTSDGSKKIERYSINSPSMNRPHMSLFCSEVLVNIHLFQPTGPRSTVWLQIQGVASLIPARSHTYMKIDYEIISTVIILPSAESLKKDCCQLQAKVCAWSTG